MHMKKTYIISGVVVAAVVLFSYDLSAATTPTDFGSAEIVAQASKIQAFLFGPTMRVAGVVGGAYGLIQAILSSSLKPLIVFGGIGLAVNIIPKFIDGIYGVSGMMLP